MSRNEHEYRGISVINIAPKQDSKALTPRPLVNASKAKLKKAQKIIPLNSQNPRNSKHVINFKLC